MDALGRGLAIMLSIIGLTFFSISYKTASLAVQRNETVRSICHAYTEEVVKNKEVSQKKWEAFQEQINRIGTYCAELTIYEQRTYKGEKGDVSLFTKQKGIIEDVSLFPGSYVRLVVTEEVETRATVFFRGAGCTIYAGGRIE